MTRQIERVAAGLLGLLAFASLTLFSAPASATSIGTITPSSPYADTITSSGPTFTRDYTFHLDSAVGGLTVLSTALGQTSSAYGVDSLTLGLFDASNNPIANASGAPIAFLDSFAQTGVALGAGDYLLSVFGTVTAGKDAFVVISMPPSIRANSSTRSSGFSSVRCVRVVLPSVSLVTRRWW